MSLSAKLTSLVFVCILFSACGGGSSTNFDSSPANPPDGQATQPTPEPTLAPEPTPTPNEPPTNNPDPVTPTPTPGTNTPTPPPVVTTPIPTSTPTPTPGVTPTPTPVAQKTSASVSWNIPDQRENGDPLELSEIGGYEIMYRKTSDLLFETVIIEDQSISDYVLENLDEGQYEFLIAVFDTEGLYSDFSDPSLVDL